MRAAGKPDLQLPGPRIAGLLIVVLAAGCAGMGCAPRESPRTGATQPKIAVVTPPTKIEADAGTPSASPAIKVDAPMAASPRSAAERGDADVSSAPLPGETQPRPAAVSPLPDGATPAATAADMPEAQPPVPVAPAGPSSAPKAAPAAKAPPKVAAVPAPKAPMPKKESAAPAKPAAAPSLDLDTLEQRLKETHAIGVLTKLTLKNQVDDLLERFKALHQGRSKATLAELRQPFDLLILKVLTLLQDGDPSLASAIRASREAIWGILTDPAKFAKL